MERESVRPWLFGIAANVPKQIRDANGPRKSPEHADGTAFKMIGELPAEQITPRAVRSALHRAVAKPRESG